MLRALFQITGETVFEKDPFKGLDNQIQYYVAQISSKMRFKYQQSVENFTFSVDWRFGPLKLKMQIFGHHTTFVG